MTNTKHVHGPGCGHTTVEHAHEHGPNCGHPAVKHDDHIDYLVDGHLHHPHDGHCDDHCETHAK
jgi:hypothetical protein